MKLESKILTDVLEDLKKAGGPQIKTIEECSDEGKEWLENYYQEVRPWRWMPPVRSRSWAIRP